MTTPKKDISFSLHCDGDGSVGIPGSTITVDLSGWLSPEDWADWEQTARDLAEDMRKLAETYFDFPTYIRWSFDEPEPNP